jgi:Carboxypeptidase regulatory-like domain
MKLLGLSPSSGFTVMLVRPMEEGARREELAMSRFRTIPLALALLVAGWLTACDKSPTKPSPPSPPPPGGQGQSQPTLQSIRVDGPTSVPPGTKAQYTATGQMSDGSTPDLTATTVWRSSDSAVLSIAANGEATGGKDGEAIVAAENSAKRASVQVLVLTPGTHRLTGLVSDSGMPIAGAAVDIVDGSRAVKSARTDGDGIYRFYGITGNVELRVHAEGYPDQKQGIPVTDDARLDFALPPGGTLAGSYELAITADSACPVTGGNPFPQDLRVRTYDAGITQDGLKLSVKLAGGSLMFGSFSGTQNGASATFDIHGITIDPFYHYYNYMDSTLDLVEQLSPTSYLIISGKATTSKVSGGLSGQLDGVIGVLGSLKTSYPNFTNSCFGKQKFVLTRR